MAVDVHPRTSLRVLTRDQQYFYQENGYLLLESIISEDWIAQLREATEEMLERSRALTESNAVFDLERNRDRLHTHGQHREPGDGVENSDGPRRDEAGRTCGNNPRNSRQAPG